MIHENWVFEKWEILTRGNISSIAVKGHARIIRDMAYLFLVGSKNEENYFALSLV